MVGRVGALLLYTLFSVGSWGQEPSLEDTRSWITTNLNASSYITDAKRGHRRCVIEFKYQNDYYYSIYLEDLPLNGISASGSALVLASSGDVILNKSRNPAFRGERLTSFEFYVGSDLAPRMVTAIKHAAKLCGASGVKEDLF